jgi:phosphotransferase system enzyme I (PtsI)
MSAILTGIGVSPGLGIGPVARLAPPPALPEDIGPEADVPAALARAEEALADVAAELEARAARAAGPAADILRAQSMMPRDPALSEQVAKALDAGRSLPHAVTDAFEVFRGALEEVGGYLAERATDLEDLRNRTVARILDRPMPGIPDPGHPYVLVAGDLAPADTASLDPARVLAIVTEQGGPTSHTAILARTLGIPAVVACPRAGALSDGTHVLVDGRTGEVAVDPDPVWVRQSAERAARRAAVLATSAGPGRTADGRPVELLVNLGGRGELEAAAAADSEGVGLLRTEFLFFSRAHAPGLAEQAETYEEVFAAFAGRKVVVRTLDAGSDKPLAFVEHGEEPNPALGLRGLRLDRLRPEMLDVQLAAVARARARQDVDVWVMAPMVSTPAEARAFVERARAHGLPCAGTMVEVPAAALRAPRLLAECDFASIGTNDLSQYAFAADRMAGELAELLDPWQPALLELVRRTAQAGHELGRPVGVCGEAAADPLLAVVLVGLGVTSLSMAPLAVPEVRLALAAHTMDACAELAELAIEAADAAEARTVVAAAARPF